MPIINRGEDLLSRDDLIGIGLYTPSEAAGLLGVRSAKIIRPSKSAASFAK
jgi:hypothetical protein